MTQTLQSMIHRNIIINRKIDKIIIEKLHDSLFFNRIYNINKSFLEIIILFINFEIEILFL